MGMFRSNRIAILHLLLGYAIIVSTAQYMTRQHMGNVQMGGQQQMQGQQNGMISGKEAGIVKTGMLFNNAVNTVVSDSVTDPKTKALMNASNPTKCIGKVYEADWKQIETQLHQQCLAEKQRKNEARIEKLNKLSKNKQCIKKVDVNALQCDIQKAVSSLMKDKFFELKILQNMITVNAENSPLYMVIIEQIKFDVEVEKEEENEVLRQQPDAELVFNRAGILLKKSGEINFNEQENKCAKCLEEIDKNVADGANACGGCETATNLQNQLSSNFNMVYKGKDEDKSTGYGKYDRRRLAAAAA